MSQDDTRDRILNAAGPIFAERGFQGATVREICRKARVNLASVNYHFGDKERLYVETIKHAHRPRLGEAPLPAGPGDAPAEGKLREFIHVTLTRMLAPGEAPWQARLMMREILQPTGACRELIEGYIRPHFELLLRILDELVPPSTPLHKRHQLGFSVIGQCMFYRFNDPVIRILIQDEELETQFRTPQLADHITDVVLAALGRAPLFGGPDGKSPAPAQPQAQQR